MVGEQASLDIASSLEDNNSLYGTPTLSLGNSSVAINAGDALDGAHNGIAIPTEDQRGAARPDTTDIGAYEYGGLIDIPEPTVQASNIAVSGLSYDKATLTWSDGDGSRRAVFIKNASSGTASPADGSNYTASAAFGSGSQIGSSGWYCVYSGTGSTVDITGLLSEHNYIAQVFEYNGTIVGTQNYLSSSATDNPKSFTTSAVSTPESQSSDIAFSSVGATSLTASWSSGDGVSRVAFIKTGTSGTALPVNLSTYTASTTFGSGTQIGSTGWYCVYNGTGSSVSVSGLSLQTIYKLQIFEYNGGAGDEHYLTLTATDNPKIQATTSRPDGENFETGDFTNFEWTTGGTGTSPNWTVTSADKNSGTFSAKAGIYQEASRISYLQVTLDVLEAGNISFYKKVSSESGYDYLRFYIDGVQPASSTWSGTVAWSQSTYAVTTGSHTLKWQYSKDGSVNSGSDTAWIDDIVFPKINPTTYVLAYTAGSGGSISGSDYQVVNEGEDGSAVEAVPETGYHFTSWDDLLSDNPRTDINVTESISVIANFAVNTYSLSYGASAPGPGTATDHGTISGSASQTVNYGSNGSAVTAVPDTGYHFVRWSDSSTANPRTDTNVLAAVNVYAEWAINTYTLSYTAGAGGTISGSASQTVNYGESGSAVIAVAGSGYTFSRWSDGLTNNPRIDTNNTASKSVSAIFEPIPESESTDEASGGNSTDSSSGGSGSTNASSATSKLLTNATNDLPEKIASIVGVLPIQTPTASPAPKNPEEFYTKAYEKEGEIIISEMRFKIIDTNGNPLAGVLVTLHSEPRQAITDANGIAIFKDIPPGDHHLEVVYSGKIITKKIAISEPEVKNKEIKMQAIQVKVENPQTRWWILLLIALGIATPAYLLRRFKLKKTKYRR